MRSIIVSANDSSSSWMNNAALDDFVHDFNESASEIWEKWFQNSSKHSSINEQLDMMRFVWKEKLNEWWCLMIEEERCMKWDSIFNKEDEICLLIDWLIL